MAAEERDVSGVALVTGGARGIGFEVVRQLAQQGMTVILAARDPERASAAAEELAGDGLDVRAGTLDVTDGASVKALAAWVEAEFGGLDVLVNNAAAFADWSETASSADLQSSRAVLDTNLFGPWLVCQAFLPLIRRSNHGRIVNVASGPGADELYDAGGRNIIKGGPGNDSIAGHGRLFGGAGDDRIDGETGIVGGPRIIAGELEKTA